MSISPRDGVPVRRIDRILTFMSLGLIVVSILCFFAVLLARPAGVTDYSEGVWPTVLLFPYIGLTLAFVLIIAVLVMSFVRRARANKGQ